MSAQGKAEVHHRDAEEIGMRVTLRTAGVPEHLHDGLIRYVLHHVAVGHFLTAVLSNDLRESFARADETSGPALGKIVAWLYWNAPSPAWGSRAAVKAWLAEPKGATS
jgi:hypothetical protein